MKLLENYILYNMLSEAKQVGLLYHTTWYLIEILNSNSILKQDWSYISFSRSKSYWFLKKGIRLVLDGNKLSEHYKIQPYFFQGKIHKKWSDQGFQNYEYEERIFKNIYNLNNYLVAIEFKLRSANEILYNLEKSLHEMAVNDDKYIEIYRDILKKQENIRADGYEERKKESKIIVNYIIESLFPQYKDIIRWI